MAEIKLKRCPCCNGEDIVTGDKAYDFGTYIYIRCRTCGLKMQICSEFGWEELFKRWNTRKPMERIMERLEDKNMSLVDSANIACNEFTDGTVNGFELAIEIVKEEGGMNE